MAKAGKKGSQGKGTGGKTRKAIRNKKKSGCSNEEIGKMVNRDGSTIGKILSGEVKNPPKGLSTAINKAKCKKSKRKVSTKSKASGKRHKM